MSVVAKNRALGDFLLSEPANFAGREIKTVSSQTLKIGQVCTSDSSGYKVPITATGNETHTITPTGSATAGTYTITAWHKPPGAGQDGYWVTTAPIAYNAARGTDDTTAGTIRYALAQVLGAFGSVSAGDMSSATAIVIVYSGTGYASLCWPLPTLNRENLVGCTAVSVARYVAAGAPRNEIQTIIWGAEATGGTFRLGFTIPAGSTGAGGVVWTDTMAWNTTDATFLSAINAALDDVLGASKVVATARSGIDTDLGIVLTFSGTGYAGIAHALVQLDTASLTSVTTATVTRTQSGGTGGNQIANNADSVCLQDISTSDTQGVFLVRGPATVNGDELYYGGAEPIVTATALATVGIIVRSEAGLHLHAH
ncbi:MAG: hypothetical protein ABFE01_15060 [Phycisphaerales bacterium]